MNSLLTVICLYICVSFSYSQKSKETKEGSDSMNSLQRKYFKTKENIPEEYIEKLKKLYDIKDPLATDYYDEYDNKDYRTHKTDSGLDYSSADYVDDSKETNDTSNETESGCSICKLREQDKKFRLETLKNEILNKLGFSNSKLPNMTGKNIPRTPSLQRLIEQYEMQGDQPYGGMDDYLPEDEYYGQIEKAYTISQPSKWAVCYIELESALIFCTGAMCM